MLLVTIVIRQFIPPADLDFANDSKVAGSGAPVLIRGADDGVNPDRSHLTSTLGIFGRWAAEAFLGKIGVVCAIVAGTGVVLRDGLPYTLLLVDLHAMAAVEREDALELVAMINAR